MNPVYKGKYISPAEAAGRWINYGGDKIWPLPEGDDDEQHWQGASTPLDDGAYAFSVLRQGARAPSRLEGPPDPPTGLQYTREISIGSDSPEISFHAITKNFTGHSITWSVQSVSQYNLSDANDRTQYNHNFWAITPMNPLPAICSATTSAMGSRTIHHSNVERRHVPAELEISGKRSLARFHCRLGRPHRRRNPICHGRKDQNTLPAETIPARRPPSSTRTDLRWNWTTRVCPILTSSSLEKTPYYMEAELNSPMVVLGPGETYAFDTTWFPSRLERRPCHRDRCGPGGAAARRPAQRG